MERVSYVDKPMEVCYNAVMEKEQRENTMENTNFADLLKDALDGRKTISENGAVMNATTGVKLLDCWYKLSSMRGMDEVEIARLFAEAFLGSDRELVLRFLFYVLDVRGGAGERRAFDTMFSCLTTIDKDLAKRLLRLVPEYGRWDLLVKRVLDRDLCDEAVSIISKQLEDDLKNASESKSVSLLAKWLPSVNCHSRVTRNLAGVVRSKLGMSEPKYRKTLSKLRKAIGIVESKMSSNEWGGIDYSKVPSVANLNYRRSFLRHDSERRSKFLEDLANGKDGAKINSSACFPHDIVHRYSIDGVDTALEEMWKSLPDYVNGDGTTLVVHDSSGSMTWNTVGTGKTKPLDVATALAIYFSERCHGPYKDKFITFSNKPKFVDLGNCKTLREKLAIVSKLYECANTDIEKTLRLVLDAAVSGGVKNGDLPRLLIISDMEFDAGVCKGNSDALYDDFECHCDEKTLMEGIADEFKRNGYDLPKISYWNVANRSGGVPCSARESGVAILSGFSPSAVKMALNGSDDPYSALRDILMDKRYDAVSEAVSEKGA